jgi:hypothetical protein
MGFWRASAGEQWLHVQLASDHPHRVRLQYAKPKPIADPFGSIRTNAMRWRWDRRPRPVVPRVLCRPLSSVLRRGRARTAVIVCMVHVPRGPPECAAPRNRSGTSSRPTKSCWQASFRRSMTATRSTSSRTSPASAFTSAKKLHAMRHNQRVAASDACKKSPCVWAELFECYSDVVFSTASSAE